MNTLEKIIQHMKDNQLEMYDVQIQTNTLNGFEEKWLTLNLLNNSSIEAVQQYLKLNSYNNVSCYKRFANISHLRTVLF
jgi:hypothetical protein